MTNTPELLERNDIFASGFTSADLPVLPKMRTVILTCVDARVDPAHVLGLELGDAVVVRNNGGRVTPEVIQEIATLAFMVDMMDAGTPGLFEIVIIQHTQCGAERMTDPNFQNAIMGKLGLDVSATAITNHEESIRNDIELLRSAAQIPRSVVVSGMIYDVKTGSIQQVFPAAPLG